MTTLAQALERDRRYAAALAEGGLELALSARQPFDPGTLLRWFGAHRVPGLEQVGVAEYRRGVAIGGTAGAIAVRLAPGRPELRLRLGPALAEGPAGTALEASRRVARMLDLGSAPGAILPALRADPWLERALAARTDLRLAGAWDGFEAAVRAILGQGVSVAASGTLLGRIVARWGEPLDDAADGVTHTFPTPERLVDADLRAVGLTAARAASVRELAGRVRDGSLRLDAGAGLDDAVERLRSVRGIGPWTAHVIAMRAFGEPDAFPAADLVLLRAAGALAGRPVSRRELEARAERWRPWRAYAATALWAYAADGGA